MAKDWARKVYDSAAYAQMRAYCYERDKGVCVMCRAPAEICDHIVELTPENVDNPAIALSPDNGQMLCWACHNQKTSGSLATVDGARFDADGNFVLR